MDSLTQGKLCVIDVSQMRGGQALVLSGIILRRIFDRNQEEFTAAEPKTIPTIAVVEEAQAVLNENSTSAEPYIAWVKEGRKYDLGALLITQQPGSIPVEILSQGDNWFIFHLLSSADLNSVKKANAHFSDDLLSSLLNEPIPGQGVFWSSVGGKGKNKTYPVPIRVMLFENMYPRLDPNYNKPAEATFSSKLKQEFSINHKEEFNIGQGSNDDSLKKTENTQVIDQDSARNESPDVLAVIKNQAINDLRNDAHLLEKIRVEGFPWGGLTAFFKDHLPAKMDSRNDAAYYLVAEALNQLLGPQDVAWESYKNSKTGKTWVRSKPS